MGRNVSVDIGPVNVRGAVRARHARVLWSDGTLYILSKRQGRIERQTIATTEPTKPDTPNGYWRATSDVGQSISFTRRGCGS
jgi:hypothetical protein